uniref:lysozyme n=1 Tax=uncultured Clostridium sp. TaxID=59620 RepID=UPI0025DB36C7
MNISNRGLDLIKSFEGCSLTAYRCPSNKWTIGWGHTNGVHQGMVITQAQADQFLFEDVQRFVNAVNQYQSRFNFNQNEYDALVSFTYNCGEGSLQAVMSCCNTKQEI